MSDTTPETRKNHTPTGSFAVGNKASVGHRPAGGRPTSEIKALLRQEGLKALPRIQQIAEDPTHREHFKANVWLAERGLKDDLEGRGTPKSSEAVSLPAWGKTENVQ